MSFTPADGASRGRTPPVPVRRFTVDEYHRMMEADIFGLDVKHELLDGWITPRMRQTPPHAYALNMTRDALQQHSPPGWCFRTLSAITLATSEAEPDVTAVPGPTGRYYHKHPGAADVALVVEVADLSLSLDRAVKGHIYAHDAITTYWIINVVDWIVEVYTQPGPTGYAQRQDYQRGDSVPLILGGQEVSQIPVVELIG